ncbi:MAG TPA: hypothetical protein VKZ94_02020 [Advenella sp.]|nr:hypothetical protein [Advenella sp.]
MNSEKDDRKKTAYWDATSAQKAQTEERQMDEPITGICLFYWKNNRIALADICGFSGCVRDRAAASLAYSQPGHGIDHRHTP